MTVTATIDWNAKVNETLERTDIIDGWSRHFYSILDLKTSISHLYVSMTIIHGSSNHLRETSTPQPQPSAPLSRSGQRIERAAHRDPVGTGATTAIPGASGKCSFLGPIGITNQQFQESGVWHVKCQTCGARRNMKEVKDRRKFPSHPSRKTPPPKGELRWILQGSEWILVKN